MAAEELQLRGRHGTFLGHVIWVSSRGGLIKLETGSEHGSVQAVLTPDQADELARDLMAYAEHARREASGS